MKRCVCLAWLLMPMFARAEVPAGALDLQRAIHQVIEKAEPSVACVLISRSTKYADLNEGPTASQPGKLGGFSPARHMQFNNGPRLALVKRLDLSDADSTPDSFGSGVVIDAGGLILTNYHVIERATKIYVRLPGDNKGSYADIVGADARADLAVLKLITPLNLKPITVGDGSRVRKGDWVISLANLLNAGFRDGSASASWGIISNIRRRGPGPADEIKRTKPLSNYGTMLQTDARLNFGCSGGAILNLNGELIGLSTSMAAITGGETAGGFAIPMTQNMLRIIEVLKKGQEVEYGFLGVSVHPDIKPPGAGGVLVQNVSPGTPAARSGIRGNDVITAIDGVRVSDNDDLFHNIATALAGNEVTVSLRGGRTVAARLVKATHSEPFIASNLPRPVFGITVDYLSTIPGDGSIDAGVLIRDIAGASPADRKLGELAGKTRLVVVAVDGEVVNTPSEFYRAAKGKLRVTLDIVDTASDSSIPRQKVILP